MSRMKTVADFLRWEPYLAESQKQRLAAVECPRRFRIWDVPQDLNSLTLEGLTRLWTIKSSRDVFIAAGGALLGLSEAETLRSPLLPMLGIVNMVSRELPKIADMWDRAHGDPTADELAAGCAQLDFGIFGLADWYARRMGMTSHDEAFATPWLRVWQCAVNDERVRQYNVRLAEVQRQHYNRNTR